MMIHHFKKTNSEDNDGDFRKRCKRVRLENGTEFLLTLALSLFTDVTSDTERHLHFRTIWRGFEEV